MEETFTPKLIKSKHNNEVMPIQIRPNQECERAFSDILKVDFDDCLVDPPQEIVKWILDYSKRGY